MGGLVCLGCLISLFCRLVLVAVGGDDEVRG